MNNKLKKVAIVITNHKDNLSKDDQVSIKHLEKYLGKFDKYFVIPKKIDQSNYPQDRFKFIKVPNKYFGSLEKYKSLMLSKYFYNKFNNYEYILLYQLDALVFSDQLIYWCNKGYDYIGSPFLNPIIGRLSHKLGQPISGANGGFSLRKVSSFLKVIEQTEKLAERGSSNPIHRVLWFILALLTCQSHNIWLNAKPKDYPFNEDGFWSYEASKYYLEFKVAPFNEALKFAFEKYPKKYFELNNHQPPFGCHAWKRYDEKFWKQYLLS